MERRKFYAALLHLNEFFGITMPEELFENYGLHAWDIIGNKQIRTYVYKTKIKDCEVDLPCNVDIIEAVLTPGADHRRSDGVNDWTADMYYGNVENLLESYKTPTEELYQSGTYLDYEQVGNTLKFKIDKTDVKILYKGVFVDEDGLPMLNFKEVDAIAKYCAWISMQKQAMMTKDKATFEIAQMMQMQWTQSLQAARTPIYLNQNDMDKVLNVMSSWDRKRFGLTFKPLR